MNQRCLHSTSRILFRLFTVPYKGQGNAREWGRKVQSVFSKKAVCLKSVIVVWRSPLHRSVELLPSNCYCLCKRINGCRRGLVASVLCMYFNSNKFSFDTKYRCIVHPTNVFRFGFYRIAVKQLKKKKKRKQMFWETAGKNSKKGKEINNFQ